MHHPPLHTPLHHRLLARHHPCAVLRIRERDEVHEPENLGDPYEPGEHRPQAHGGVDTKEPCGVFRVQRVVLWGEKETEGGRGTGEGGFVRYGLRTLIASKLHDNKHTNTPTHTNTHYTKQHTTTHSNTQQHTYTHTATHTHTTQDGFRVEPHAGRDLLRGFGRPDDAGQQLLLRVPKHELGRAVPWLE